MRKHLTTGKSRLLRRCHLGAGALPFCPSTVNDDSFFRPVERERRRLRNGAARQRAPFSSLFDAFRPPPADPLEHETSKKKTRGARQGCTGRSQLLRQQQRWRKAPVPASSLQQAHNASSATNGGNKTPLRTTCEHGDTQDSSQRSFFPRWGRPLQLRDRGQPSTLGEKCTRTLQRHAATGWYRRARASKLVKTFFDKIVTTGQSRVFARRGNDAAARVQRIPP